MQFNRTIIEVRHVERLTHSLHRILETELGVRMPLRVCLGTVAAGHAIRHDLNADRGHFLVGRPWCPTAALNFLAGRGFIFDPRTASEALNRLERRHIVDRRRLERRHAPRPAGAEAHSKGREIEKTIGKRKSA